MKLDLLPHRTDSAPGNMALDFLLLQRYPDAAVRFRHYGWRRPSFTFGYSQKIAFVRANLPEAVAGFDLCRRPTGGGIVDHRDDWTYALVIPRGHSLEEQRAAESYRTVHEALAAALRRQGVPAITKAVAEPADDEPTAPGPGVCFQRAELHDVVHEITGEKIAGAAQKRNKHGLLFQGSLWRPAAGGVFDGELFYEAFAGELARALTCDAAPTPWPELAEDEVEGLTERYAAPEWNEAR